MTPHQAAWLSAISLITAAAAFLLVRFGWTPARVWFDRRQTAFDRALRQQLMVDIEPRTLLILWLVTIALAGVLGFILTASLTVALLLVLAAFFLPHAVIKHLEEKRRDKLNEQLVDGLTTLSAGARAGLNLVQSMQLIQQNHHGPIQQEFAHILREYDMGMDLNQTLRRAANRIGSPVYRLTFTAIEMHRLRGGNSAESLDRIAQSIREIRRLEGKLDALTAQGRSQATMMAVMPLVFLLILYAIDPQGVAMLFENPVGRLILLGVLVTIGLAFLWIRKIMSIDI